MSSIYRLAELANISLTSEDESLVDEKLQGRPTTVRGWAKLDKKHAKRIKKDLREHQPGTGRIMEECPR